MSLNHIELIKRTREHILLIIKDLEEVLSKIDDTELEGRLSKVYIREKLYVLHDIRRSVEVDCIRLCIHSEDNQ